MEGVAATGEARGSAAELRGLARRIREWGAELGFQQVGIADVDLAQAERRLEAWLSKRFHGEMDYMARHGRKRSRPGLLVPGTVRVISARMDYLPESPAAMAQLLDHAEKAYISRYALGRDYHKVLRGRLKVLARRIEADAGRFGGRAFCDSAPVLEKPLAEKAGLGWIGKHTNLINRRAGSWFFLGELYTNLALPVDEPETSHCGSCRACLDVCPTGAIVAPYELDARRCISYLTIEFKGSIPAELRGLIGNRIYGCDDCQLFCPWNKFAMPTAEADFAPRHGLDDAGLAELMQWNEETWLARTEGSAIRRIGYEQWVRNVAVALGNAEYSRRHVKLLEARLADPSPLVREHVKWALREQRGKRKELQDYDTLEDLPVTIGSKITDRIGETVSTTQDLSSDYKRSLLAGLDLFRGVRPDDVQTLLQKCERRDVAKGELLLSPGSKNQNVFIVLSGSLNVHVGSPDAPVLAVMEVGACVGEMSIIEDRDPSAYVIAAEPTHLLVIHKSILWDMVNASHEFSKNLLVVLSERVRSHNHYIAASFGDLRRFERNATTDALTGLGNRHAMEETFPREVQRCIQNGEPASLIMIDVDRFKTFNDRFGHVAGDRALSAVAEELRKHFRPRDHVVRFGGDEFAVLMPGMTVTEAIAVAERVRQAISGTTGKGDDSLIRMPVMISVGVAEIGEGDTFDTLLRAADDALYRAKDSGRNTVASEPPRGDG